MELEIETSLRNVTETLFLATHLSPTSPHHTHANTRKSVCLPQQCNSWGPSTRWSSDSNGLKTVTTPFPSYRNIQGHLRLQISFSYSLFIPNSSCELQRKERKSSHKLWGFPKSLVWTWFLPYILKTGVIVFDKL